MGFIEGEGRLGVLRLPEDELNVEFSIEVQNRDGFLLFLIKRLLHIPSKVTAKVEENGYLELKTKQSRAISNIIDMFSAKDYKFKGMKSLEFKL